MPRYARDPRWLTARFESKCSGKNCNATIKKGEQAFYYPSTKSILCKKEECGVQAARDFEAATQDEAFTTGNW